MGGQQRRDPNVPPADQTEIAGWLMLDSYGLLWVIMDYYGLLWNIMGYYGMNYYGL